jgi:hypothetical protein
VKLRRVVLLLTLVSGITGAMFCIFGTSALGRSTRVERLRNVSSVYIAGLGQTERAKALREKLTRELSESGRIRVVDAPDEADAILSLSVRQGSKNVDSPFQSFADPSIKTGSRVVPEAEIVFRLNNQQRQTLWAIKFDSENFRGKDDQLEVQALANNLSRELLKAIEKDRKRRR